MYTDNKILVAKSEKELYLLPKMANRHGLISGATGTGKTVTMKVLAESFSDMGVPVFFADVKGDLTGTCEAGKSSEKITDRLSSLGIEDFSFKSYPTRFWDIYGEKGHPVRVTISQMGPTLLAHMLSLTEIQTGVLNIVFKVADDLGMLLLDFKDLRAMLQYVGDNRAEYSVNYGNVSAASIGAIQRALLAFEQEGGEMFFGEPELDINDWMKIAADGRGYINILSSAKLVTSPLTYGTFLLWMLSELYETLPEVGDLEKPKMIFFFDEAHLLFNNAQKPLIQKIVQIVKMIRSKGVGVYFISQSPSDIPGDVLAQLSNKVQHALRAYTPNEQKAVKAAAKAFRPNPAFDTEQTLMELGTGEALVSFLDEEGIPEVVEKAVILPPQSYLGAADAYKVDSMIKSDEFYSKYLETVDRESAYEIIMAANVKLEEERALAAAEAAAAKVAAKEQKAAEKKANQTKKAAERAVSSAASSVSRTISSNLVNTITGGKTVSTQTMIKRAATNALSSVMRSGTNAIVRGLFGNKK